MQNNSDIIRAAVRASIFWVLYSGISPCSIPKTSLDVRYFPHFVDEGIVEKSSNLLGQDCKAKPSDVVEI